MLVNNLYETPFLAEEEDLIYLIRNAEIDPEYEIDDDKLTDWFYHILISNGARLENLEALKYRATHICKKDLSKIMDYIGKY